MFSCWQQLLRQAWCWMCCLVHLQLPGSSGLPPSPGPCVSNPWLHVAVTWGLSCEHKAKAAPRFSAGNKAEAASWASHFLQREGGDAERSCLAQECGVRAEGRGPGGGMGGCVLVVPVGGLRFPQGLVLVGLGSLEMQERHCGALHQQTWPSSCLPVPPCPFRNTSTRQCRAPLRGTGCFGAALQLLEGLE